MWINVAFTSVFAPFWEIGPDEFQRVTEVSYLGFVFAPRPRPPACPLPESAKGADMRFNGIFCAARAGLGTAYLLFPALPGPTAGTDHNARAARITARILGARYLTRHWPPLARNQPNGLPS